MHVDIFLRKIETIYELPRRNYELNRRRVKALIDTGAAYSVIPKYIVDKNNIAMKETAVSLYTASGATIKIFGEVELEILLPNSRRVYRNLFIVSELPTCILGLSFFKEAEIIINPAKNILRDTVINMNIPCSPTTFNKNQKNITWQLAPPGLHPAVKKIITTYPGPIEPGNATKKENQRPTVEHLIVTGDCHPCSARARKIHPEMENLVKQDLQRLINEKVIRPSNSDWSSPMHMVSKPEKKIRIVGDYRVLNSKTRPDKYPIPHIGNFTAQLKNKKFFSKLDLANAYNQIPLREEDIKKTAVITPFGAFEWLFLPFGLRNAPATFQRYVDNIFRGCENIFVYLDDILVYSESEAEHARDLENVFKILDEHNLKVKINKCEFFAHKIEFLGYQVTPEGLMATQDKIEALDKFKPPTSAKELAKFLGFIGFYRKLIPKFADKALPLTEKIRLSPKYRNVDLSVEEAEAYENLINELKMKTILAHPDPNCSDYQLYTDASSTCLGGALHEMVNGEAIPIGFMSKKLTEAQRKYSTYDRELLAAFESVIYFKHFIEGRQVTLVTDHKPLVAAFKSETPQKSDRQQRHLSIITEYVTDIIYTKGEDNIAADVLSRIQQIKIDPFDLPEIARQQKENMEPKLETINNEKLKKYNIGKAELWCDTSLPYPRPYVPSTMRKIIFDELHNMAHQGSKRTQALIKARYMWPQMRRDITQWCAECENCQQAKITRHTNVKPIQFQLPAGRFECLHLDLVGPLPPAQSEISADSTYRYILTMIDRNTKWIEAIPLVNQTATAVAEGLMDWIARFGVPKYVVTDRGTQFESELFKEISKGLGFYRLRTTAYHPQANGQIENLHRTIKAAIRARKEQWLKALPIILLSLRNTPNSSGYSPQMAVTGTEGMLPAILIDESHETEKQPQQEQAKQVMDLMEEIRKYKENTDLLETTFEELHIPKNLEEAEFAWLRKDRVRQSLEAPYSGPYKILKKGPKTFTILIKEKETVVSVERLKPFRGAGKRKETKTTKKQEKQSHGTSINNSTEPTKISNTKQNNSREQKPTHSRYGRKLKWKTPINEIRIIPYN